MVQWKILIYPTLQCPIQSCPTLSCQMVSFPILLFPWTYFTVLSNIVIVIVWCPTILPYSSVRCQILMTIGVICNTALKIEVWMLSQFYIFFYLLIIDHWLAAYDKVNPSCTFVSCWTLSFSVPSHPVVSSPILSCIFCYVLSYTVMSETL